MEDHYQRAVELFVGDRYDQCMSVLEKSQPQSCRSLTLRAVCLLKTGKLSDARKSIKDAQLQPSSDSIALENAQYWAGVIAFSSADYSQAVNIFTTLCQKVSVPKYGEWLRKAEMEQKLRGPQKPYTWSQTGETVSIVFPLVPNFKKEVVVFGEREVSVSLLVEGAAEKHYAFDLYERVKKSECKASVVDGQLVISLPKQVADLTWSTLEFKDETASSSKQATPAYPTSSKTKKDWSKIDRICEAELRTEAPQGEAALNDFFKQIYSNGDEDARRAMIKSFQTSGGTVLSTDWKDVKAKDYEGSDRPDAPDGQTWADGRKRN